MLKRFIRELKRRRIPQERVWFQQDAATPHATAAVMTLWGGGQLWITGTLQVSSGSPQGHPICRCGFLFVGSPQGYRVSQTGEVLARIEKKDPQSYPHSAS